jgi:hypothetical protein
MNTTINLSHYPIFIPNQVLTDEDLNRVVNHFEGLNQLTLTYFVGMGIAYGLDVQHLSNPTRIRITPGYGITSKGFVIKWLPEPGRDVNTFTHYQDTTIAKNLFIAGEEPSQSYSVKELLPSDRAAGGTNAPQPLTEEGLQQKVVVVLYDWEDADRYEVGQLSYEEPGVDRRFRLRFFLLPRTGLPNTDPSILSAERLLRTSYQIDKLPAPWKSLDSINGITAIFESRNYFFKEFNLKIRRFGYIDSTDINLARINNYKALQDNYFRICEVAIDEITNAFPQLFKLFSPLFTTFHPNSPQDFNELNNNLNKLLNSFNLENRHNNSGEDVRIEPPYALQYFYDYLSQLIAAFIELAEVAFDLMDGYTPNMDHFPRFLMLGLTPAPDQLEDDTYELPSAYRTQFIQPGIYNSNQSRLKQVCYLYERLRKLCNFEKDQESFYPLPFYHTPIKITPGKDRSTPLSEQAIPYYLNYPRLYQYWNYDAYRKGRSDRHPAYFYPKQDANEPAHTFDELTYRLDAYNFYRIEGHIGRSNTDAFKGIQDFQQRYNLPFDIITLKLGNLSSLNDLNISAQVSDLNDSFGRIKDRFQTQWQANEQTWKNNAVLNTLKQIFFDQAGLEKVNPDLMLSPLLDRAQIPESYEFVAESGADNQPTGKYRLFLRSRSGTQIAQYIFHLSGDGISDDRKQQDIDQFSFTGFTNEEIAQEKTRIVAGLVDAFTPDKVTYNMEKPLSESDDRVSFHLRLSSNDRLSVPLEQSQEVSQQEITLELRSLSPCWVRSRDLIFEDPNCPDVLTLYGLLRDTSESPASTPEVNFGLGKEQAEQALGVSEFKSLVEAYQQRLQRLINFHLFDLFAKQHPGMEPLGGVPKGGTFVLVYVDGQDIEPLIADEKNPAIAQARTQRTETIRSQAWLPPSSLTDKPVERTTTPTPDLLLKEVRKRKDIVVADFCLPYRSSSSNTPAISYVLARPRPILLLPKIVFCEGDQESYRFILEPEGGAVKGEGVIVHEQQHFFKPANINQSSQDELAKGNKVVITFSYAVDDTYDTLMVTVHPLPKAALSLNDGQSFCQNASPVEIALAPGTSEDVELVQVTINDIETNTFVPAQFATEGQSQTVTITARIRNMQTQCENTLTHTVIIHPLPEAALSIDEGQNFCQNGSSVEITLASETPEDVELVDVTIDGIQTNTLVPEQYATQGQSQTVTIVARIRNTRTQCENTLTRTVIIHPLPLAELSIQEGQNFCQDESSIEITLAPRTSQDVELVDVTIDGIATNTFVPEQYVTDGQSQTVEIVAQIRNTQTQCENTLTRTVIIHPLPLAELSIDEGQNFTNNASPVEITLAPDTSEDIELGDVTINGRATTTLNPNQYATVGQPETITIKAHLHHRQSNCTNTVIRRVTITPLPEAELSIQDGQNVAQNASPVEITLAPGTSEDVELVDVTINGTPTNTLVPEQYATAGQSQTVTIVARIRNIQTQYENTLTRTVTIHPLPIADFKAEIANIDSTGFSVRVFDIQPAGQPSFNFNWATPDGKPDPENPSSSDFTIHYDVDFSNWVAGAEVFITLQVSTPPEFGNSSSEPVTKTIAIPLGGVQSLNLVTINPDGNTRIPLENNPTFPKSFFTGNYTFEAVAAGKVSSVVFTYTAPDGSVTISSPANPQSSVDDLDYFMMLGSSGPYWPWQPIIGTHRIQAQAFEGTDGDGLEGLPFTMTLTITDDSPTSPPEPPTPNAPGRFSRIANLFRPATPRNFAAQAVHSPPIASSEDDRPSNLVDISMLRQSSGEVQLFPKVKLAQTLAISATMLLLALGWTYASNQAKTSAQPGTSERIQNSPQ